ncbi:Aconitase A/isopropylmalate dehydratase small subunit, swivel [Kalmanozyma brasiliensis GHG001]|uniref:Aconitase/homoaconitase n=1 Tax=Kalmanozyma brasiliensis (strain GHG001) TaxID=1365824 RepID=V5E5K1_KALBG|nr:Aconitase A/isopropylmalate dehydratase small subunit, swivel [Kalmanozyma brasiliensis GHG001]EST05496.1 Aconitase A/isopropylmalate dehydratase small subunit, swivel [Kalmanozyma brasiliensis GHG001]
MIASLARVQRGRNGISAAQKALGATRSLATPAADGRVPTFHPSRVPPYTELLSTLETVRAQLNRPLTLSEKILYSHLRNPEQDLAGVGSDVSAIRGKKYLKLKIDRLAMQDASAQMALLQFMTCGLPRTAIPSSVHCDHLIQAYEGAEADLKRSIASNQEVFAFLESASQKYGIEFWGPGSGIIHQIVLENYAAPGLLMLGTDSHTPNASGLGCLAIGVGGADAVDAMTNTPWELMAPKVLGVHLKGELSPWCTPKDVILHLAGKLTVRGGTGKIVEYSGPGLQTLPATGLATMSNMGAEVGATTSAFPFTPAMGSYLEATGRAEVARAAEKAAGQGFLAADEGAEYDERIEINLSDLEPCLNGPFTPDLSTPLSEFVNKAKSEARDHPVELSAALIGSCTNSSYADMARCASLAQQARDRGMKVKSSFDVTPGSEQVRATVERDGIQQVLTDVGGRVLANACGPCIGQWNRKELQGEENVILTSFNRNFRGRNDGNSKTWNMLASPEIVTAMAFAGRLDFNPMTDTLTAPDGKPFKFEPPQSDVLPASGFAQGDVDYLPAPMPEPQPDTEVLISPTSARLEPLEPFSSPFAATAAQGKYELPTMRCLLRIKGKCTTDHISAAGPWLKYKGHLSNLAENTLIGATNDEFDAVNVAQDYETGKQDTIPGVAKIYKSRQQPWMMVADHNYGEGSAREHAALQPRFYGCNLIVARSIARIAETNLRKQGVLTLLFENEDDYLRIGSGDLVETVNLTDLIRPGGDLSTQVKLKVTKFEQDGSTVKETFELPTKHSLSAAHLDWIRAGSALNLIREQASRSSAAAGGVSGAFAAAANKVSSALGSVRGYATAAKPSTGGSRNPNDPNYIPPAADPRTDSIRKIVYPPTSAKDKAATSAASVLPFPAEQAEEIHSTITRAWLLFQRTQRESLSERLDRKQARLREALTDLKSTDERLYAAATYKVAPNKRSPKEHRRLVELGLVTLPGAEPKADAPSGAEARRLVKAVAGGARLEGLFPREMRVPTATPGRKVWPAFEGAQ